AQSQKLRHFIKRLPGGVVASKADVPISPEILLQLRKIKMRMATGDYQSQHRNMKRAIFALPLLQQHGMDVSLKMVHGDQRLLQCESQRLGKADADQQGPRQSRALRDRDSVD